MTLRKRLRKVMLPDQEHQFQTNVTIVAVGVIVLVLAAFTWWTLGNPTILTGELTSPVRAVDRETAPEAQ